MNLKEMSLIFLAIVALTFSGQAQDNYKQINISDDLSLIRISSHAYVHVSYGDIPGFGRAGSNGVVFINNGEAFLFDTPISDELTRTLVMWLSDSMKVRVTGFAPNHWHIDCMGGLAWLKSQGIRSYANQKTIEIAKSKSLPVPDEGFTDSSQSC
jgi:metallo-beta-lactamase class B